MTKPKNEQLHDEVELTIAGTDTMTTGREALASRLPDGMLSRSVQRRLAGRLETSEGSPTGQESPESPETLTGATAVFQAVIVSPVCDACGDDPTEWPCVNCHQNTKPCEPTP
jgi:hypothetical protein